MTDAPKGTPTQLTEVRAGYVHLLEYVKLKDEQIKRIEFRDHMIHIQLVIVGGIIAWTFYHGLETRLELFPLLIIPAVSLILGWTYLINDDRISALGRYIREDLTRQLEQLVDVPGTTPLGWEYLHRTDEYRMFRRVTQFAIDVITFPGSGVVALYTFWSYGPRWSEVASAGKLLFILDLILVPLLFALFLTFAEFKREKRPSSLKI